MPDEILGSIVEIAAEAAVATTKGALEALGYVVGEADDPPPCGKKGVVHLPLDDAIHSVGDILGAHGNKKADRERREPPAQE
jgi:hypothetical protein